MNAVLTPFRQLVDRKLWPLAILLIAALAAVPFLLAKEDAPEPIAPIASAGVPATTAESATQPIVTLGSPTDREAARKVLGSRKNPFKPAGAVQKAAAAKTSTTPTATGGVSGDSGKGKAVTGSGGSTPATDAPVVGVSPAQPAVRKKAYELYQLKIRFGATSSDDLANRSVKRLTALPAMANPVLVYLGLKKDLKTAVFLVDANTLVVGDGTCVPSPTNCQNLELKKGQTAFIDVLGEGGASTAQYQLDYVKVLKRTTTDAKAARAARRAVAKGGRDALRANISRVNGWDYDAESGVLVAPEAE
jgi:hypothetical protein